jgi:hypothetical protein
MRGFICGILLVASLQTAAAAAQQMSGAWLVQNPSDFAIGYAMGVVDLRIRWFTRQEDDPQLQTINRCVANSGMDGKTVYQMAVDYIRRNPKMHNQPAVFAVVNALAEACVP